MNVLASCFPVEVIADGGGGSDDLFGGERDNHLDGGPGNDYLSGGPRDDDLVGGDGNDVLFGGPGIDTFDGGAGNDDLRAQESPPAADAAIACGDGNDTLFVDDGLDEVPDDCELTDPPKLDGGLLLTGEARVGAVLSLRVSCQISVTARPSGASARLRGRPAIAGATHVPVVGGVQRKVTLALNPRAYRLLRAHRRLTLSVTAVLARPGYASSRATFTITIKAPARPPARPRAQSTERANPRAALPRRSTMG